MLKHMVPSSIITKNEIANSLKRQMPDALPEMIEPFVAQVCDNKASVTLDELLLNAFSNTSLPLTVVKDGD